MKDKVGLLKLLTFFPVKIDELAPEIEIKFRRLSRASWIAEIEQMGKVSAPTYFELFCQFQESQFSCTGWLNGKKQEVSLPIGDIGPEPSSKEVKDVRWIAIVSRGRKCEDWWGRFKGKVITSERQSIQTKWVLKTLAARFRKTVILILLYLVALSVTVFFLARMAKSLPIFGVG